MVSQVADRGPWIQTFTGRAFHYTDVRPEDIHIADIAQALSHQCRFAGQTTRFYSVAEHSVRVSRQFANPELRMIGLLHDATEAYILDLPTPLKQLLPAYGEYEESLYASIARRFDLPPEIPAAVHEADKRMLVTERPQLFTRLLPWSKYDGVLPFDVTIQCWSPGEARIAFMSEFNDIQAVR